MFRLQGSGSVVQSSKGSRMNKAHLAVGQDLRTASWRHHRRYCSLRKFTNLGFGYVKSPVSQYPLPSFQRAFQIGVAIESRTKTQGNLVHCSIACQTPQLPTKCPSYKITLVKSDSNYNYNPPPEFTMNQQKLRLRLNLCALTSCPHFIVVSHPSGRGDTSSSIPLLDLHVRKTCWWWPVR